MTRPEAAGPLRLERRGKVLLLRFDRPEKRNAVDLALAAALSEAMEHAMADDEVSVVVITGSGSSFCAGADLANARPFGPAATLDGAAAPITAPLDRFTKPVVAAVNGPAYGGGCELALAADLRVAGASATFCLPEAKIGSMPGSGGVEQLCRAVGSAAAAKMLFTGEPVDAVEAARIGLVSDVFDDDVLVEEACALGGRIAQNAPLSLLAIKHAMRAVTAAGAGGGENTGGMTLERALWGLLSTTADRAEGRAAFKDRRAPRFEGR